MACELREIIDAVKDPDAARVIPHMIPVLLDCLRTGEPSYQKDSLEYAFRKTLLEILHRIPLTDIVRPQAHAFFSGMLNVIRNDNEENAIIGCKVLVELTRSFRPLSEDLTKEFFTIFYDRCRNLAPLVHTQLSEDASAPDQIALLPSNQSLKVYYELSNVLYSLLQMQRQAITPAAQESIHTFFDVLDLEAPAQKAARENYEAMGNCWSGMVPTIRNASTYVDLISAQVKV